MQEIQKKYDAAFNSIAAILYDRDQNDIRQDEYNAQRLADFIEAIRYRPYFLPVQIPMPALVQVLPKIVPTPTVDGVSSYNWGKSPIEFNATVLQSGGRMFSCSEPCA